MMVVVFVGWRVVWSPTFVLNTDIHGLLCYRLWHCRCILVQSLPIVGRTDKEIKESQRGNSNIKGFDKSDWIDVNVTSINPLMRYSWTWLQPHLYPLRPFIMFPGCAVDYYCSCEITRNTSWKNAESCISSQSLSFTKPLDLCLT